MTDAFWSHWGWPLATAVLGLVFSGLVFSQWLQRRKAHQMAWTVGLLIYGVAAAMEFWSEYSGVWDVTVYRVYMVLAASMVGFLGLGTLYLMAKDKRWGHAYLAFNIVAIALFLWGTFTYRIDPGLLKPGITVGGSALGDRFGWPRVMSFAFNMPGTVLLLGGAILSAWRFSRKREYAYRMWGNVLIALGTIAIAIAGSRARAGDTVGLYPAEMVASILLLSGFLVAGTLERGAAAVRSKLASRGKGAKPGGEAAAPAAGAVSAPDEAAGADQPSE